MHAKDDPEYTALLDKLYELTGEAKLRPGGMIDPLARICAAKDLDTQVMIDEAHSRPALPNGSGEALQPKDIQMLRNIGDEVKRCWFGDADGDYHASYGRKGAGYLAHKIWRHMNERQDWLCHYRFVQCSCHDTTMAALAAHLGVELPEIGFGAFMLFELHRCPEGRARVKFYYNGRPSAGAKSYADLRPYKLPLAEGRLVSLNECPSGDIPLETFQEHCQIEGLEESFDTFTKLLARADISDTREDLQSLLKESNSGWLSFEEWQDEYDQRFRSYDANNDGFLERSEMEAALSDWYGITGKTVDLVFHLVDREPNTDKISEEDFYLAMVALVGVRGSISSKTAGGISLLEEENQSDVLDDVDTRSSGGITKLMVAANTGDLDRVKDLIARGADIDGTDDFGWTALRYAVRRKDSAIVQELIKLGADVNLASVSGRTPLMSAVANDVPNVVQLLVDNGADLDAVNSDGLTAFGISQRGGGTRSSVIRSLVWSAKTVGFSA